MDTYTGCGKRYGLNDNGRIGFTASNLKKTNLKGKQENLINVHQQYFIKV